MQLICMQIQVSPNVPVCTHPHSVRNKQIQQIKQKETTQTAHPWSSPTLRPWSSPLQLHWAAWSSTKDSLNSSRNKQDAHRVTHRARSLTPHTHCKSLAVKHPSGASRSRCASRACKHPSAAHASQNCTARQPCTLTGNNTTETAGRYQHTHTGTLHTSMHTAEHHAHT